MYWDFSRVLQFRLSFLWTPSATCVFFLLVTKFIRIWTHNACQILKIWSPYLLKKYNQSHHSFQISFWLFGSSIFIWKGRLFSYFLLEKKTGVFFQMYFRIFSFFWFSSSLWSGMFCRMVAGYLVSHFSIL